MPCTSPSQTEIILDPLSGNFGALQLTAQWVGRLRGPATRLAPQAPALDGGGHAELDRPVG